MTRSNTKNISSSPTDIGAILGGLALGVIETMGASYISVPYKDAVAYAMLLAFLMVRPQGMFGEKMSEKAWRATFSACHCSVKPTLTTKFWWWTNSPSILAA